MATYVPPKKNTAFKFYVGLIDQSNTKLLKANPTIATGDFKVSTDGGAFANLATLPSATPASGRAILIDLSAGEMNGDNIVVQCVDAAGAEWCDLLVNIQTSARQVDDLAYPATSGRSMVVDAAGLVDANAVKLGPTGAGTAQTARDVGASVLLSAGSGTGQLDFTSGVVKANLVQILGTALTETAGQIAAAFKKFFNIATPAATMDHLILVDTVTTYTGNTVQTGDSFARLGAPAGASISADIAAIDAAGLVVAAGYVGDFRLGWQFSFKFLTVNPTTGVPTALLGTPEISVFIGDNTTQLTAGITLTVDFDGRAGLNHVTILPSGGNGYTAPDNYTAVITIGTVAGISAVNQVVGSFSLESRSALMPTTAARTLVVDAAGLADANVVKLGPTGAGTAQTARDVGATLGVAGAGLTALGDVRIANLDAAMSTRATPAQVKTQVTDALNVDTYAEPAQGAPAATATLVTKLGFLFKAWRNRQTQTSTTYSLFNDDAVTVDHKSTVSDDSTTFNRTEIASGP